MGLNNVTRQEIEVLLQVQAMRWLYKTPMHDESVILIPGTPATSDNTVIPALINVIHDYAISHCLA